MPKNSLFGLEEDDDEQERDDEQDEETDEEEDDLADVNPELRARIEKVASRRVSAVEGRLNAVREKARERGVAITDDGDLALLDRQRLGDWVPQQPQASASATTSTAAAADEEDEEIPDPSLDPRGFQKWFNKEQKKAVEEATKPIMAQLQQTQYAVASREAEAATRRAAQVVEDYGLGEIARHPAFAETFARTLMASGAEDWRDDETLARVAFMIIPDLKKQPVKKGFPQQGADGRWVNSKDLGRAAISRGMTDQSGPSRGSAKRGTDPQYDDIDRLTAERFNISLEEARALKDPSGDAYTAIQAKKAGKGRR